MQTMSPFREDGALAEAFETAPFATENGAARIVAGRHAVEHVPLLASHRGRPPDLILHWNDMPSAPSAVDVVVHLHGNSVANLSLPDDIERVSGLDLGARTRPTLGILPRGDFTGRLQSDRSRYVYEFPAFDDPAGLTQLIDVALTEFAARNHVAVPTRGRLILTAHSHGGRALMPAVAQHDPDEVHVFDALYWSPDALVRWTREHMRRDAAATAALDSAAVREHMATRGTALRVFWLTTGPYSREVAAAIARERTPAIADWYRVEATTYGHMDIPRAYGSRVLADASADVPRTARRRLHHEEESFEQEDTEEEAPPLNDLPELRHYELLSSALEDVEVEGAEAEAFLAEDTGATVTFPSGATLRVVAGPTGPHEDHWDPNHTGNPLLDTSEPMRSTKLSKDFTVREFLGPRDYGGHELTDMARIDPKLVDALQRIRDRVGKPVHIDSGYRSYKYNYDLYTQRYHRPPTESRHSGGEAADIKIDTMTGMEIAKLAIDVLGPNIGVGIDRDYAHIDVRGVWAKWTYFRDKAESDRALAEIEAYRRGRSAAPQATLTAPPAAQPPHLVEALGRGLWDTAVRIAIESGITDVNQLTNTIFYFRHPDMRGRQIGPDQRDLAREWVDIRDRWVVPSLASHPSTHAAHAHGHGRSEHDLMARVRPLLEAHRGDIPLDFVLGWVYVESGGVNTLPPTRELGELGYFQISREESHMLGVDHARIATDPDYSVQAGIKLVRHYADLARSRFPGVPYGSELFWRVVKFIHAMGSGDAPSLLRQMQRDGHDLSSWDAISHYAAAEGDRLVRLGILRRHPARFIANVDRVYSEGRRFAAELAAP